jgi:hypothetical protein
MSNIIEDPLLKKYITPDSEAGDCIYKRDFNGLKFQYL